jgi:hypothetical protein
MPGRRFCVIAGPPRRAGRHRLDSDGGAQEQRTAEQLGGREQLAEHQRGEQGGGQGFAQRQHRGLSGPDAPQASQEQQRRGPPVQMLYPLLIERPWKKYASTLRTGT